LANASTPPVRRPRREERVEQVPQPPVVLAVDVQDVPVDLLAQRSGVDAEQFGDLLARERGRPVAEEELAGFSVEGEIAQRRSGQPRGVREGGHVGDEPVATQLGVVGIDERQIEVGGSSAHGSGPYSARVVHVRPGRSCT
jgi:hypothetical protein